MGSLLQMALGALGVVYGDIGTSPLYTINEIFFGHADLVHNALNVLGGISLVLWSLTIIVSFKYIIFVLRADNDGEGGVFALYGLLAKKKFAARVLIITLLIFAAGLLYGDGIITPAISVISAVEGLKVATAAFQPYIVPITILILTGLFAIQSRGTSKIGSIFGPVIIVWFLSIAGFGALQIIKHPGILAAVNPYYAVVFLFSHTILTDFLVLGSVMLAVTGGEAMYADLGHFGRRPIRLSWFVLVYPALLLNYLGQGAYLLSGSKVIFGNVFYSLVPHLFLIPMVVVATAATIIASQALISGAYSLTTQAMAFDLFPFMKVNHTNEDHHGQIYLSIVNWILYIGTVILVLVFKTSANLAGAYGLAVSGVMLMTTVGMYYISRLYWKWAKFKSLLLFGFLGLFETLFLSANTLKIFQGGYIPLSIAIVILSIMLIWNWGTNIKTAMHNGLVRTNMSVKELIKIKSKTTATDTIARSSIFLSTRNVEKKEDKIPVILQVFYDRYRELPEDIVILNVHIDRENPHLHDKRYEVIKFFADEKKGSIFSVRINFGFMEEPNVEKILEDLAEHHEINLDLGASHWLVHALNKRLLYKKKVNFFTMVKFSIYNFFDNISMKADHYFGLGNETELTVEVVPVKFSQYI